MCDSAANETECNVIGHAVECCDDMVNCTRHLTDHTVLLMQLTYEQTKNDGDETIVEQQRNCFEYRSVKPYMQ